MGGELLQHLNAREALTSGLTLTYQHDTRHTDKRQSKKSCFKTCFYYFSGSGWCAEDGRELQRGQRSALGREVRRSDLMDVVCVCVTYSQHGVLLDFVRKAVEKKKKGFYLNRKEKKAREGRKRCNTCRRLQAVPLSDSLRIMTDLSVVRVVMVLNGKKYIWNRSNKIYFLEMLKLKL